MFATPQKLWIASSAGFAGRVELTSPAFFLNSSLRRQPSIGPTRRLADALSCATSARIPSAMNKVGLYARCSTRDKQDPATQLVPLREYARQRQLEIVGEYVDLGFSGARERRPSSSG